MVDDEIPEEIISESLADAKLLHFSRKMQNRTDKGIPSKRGDQGIMHRARAEAAMRLSVQEDKLRWQIIGDSVGSIFLVHSDKLRAQEVQANQRHNTEGHTREGMDVMPNGLPNPKASDKPRTGFIVPDRPFDMPLTGPYKPLTGL